MTIAQCKNWLRSEIKTRFMYSEGLEDAIETTIEFEMFIRFVRKSTIFHPKQNPKQHAGKLEKQEEATAEPKQKAEFPKPRIEELESVLLAEG